MPSILKRFISPKAAPYEFPSTDDLVLEAKEGPPLVSQGEERLEPKPDAVPQQTPVDFARLQADAILEHARNEAEELMERARAEASLELSQLRSLAQEEGFRAGFTEGLTRAAVEVQNQREAQAAQLAGEVSRFLEKASLAQEELLQNSQDELRDLALAIAEKVVQVSLKSSSQVVSRMIQRATEKLKRKEWVHIYIGGCDAKTLAHISPNLTPALSALSDQVKIIPISDEEAGTLIIEMPDEIIDASVSTQLSNIRDLLSEPHTR